MFNRVIVVGRLEERPVIRDGSIPSCRFTLLLRRELPWLGDRLYDVAHFEAHSDNALKMAYMPLQHELLVAGKLASTGDGEWARTIVVADQIQDNGPAEDDRALRSLVEDASVLLQMP